ncbi:MAG: tRNA 4-thiouridine(8) synthase ThiI, partial [Sulfurimonas sp.]
MKKQKFILKLFPEIMIKGSSAKRQMVGQLYQNLLTIFERIDANIEVKKFSDKIEVLTPPDVLPEVRE